MPLSLVSSDWSRPRSEESASYVRSLHDQMTLPPMDTGVFKPSPVSRSAVLVMNYGTKGARLSLGLS